MKKMKTKLALSMATVLMMYSMVLTGCQGKLAPTDQVVRAVYDPVVEENVIPVKDLLGFASRDDVRSPLLAKDHIETTDVLKGQFGGFDINFTDEEVQGMSDTTTGLSNELSYMAEIQGGTRDKATVLLRVIGYSSDGLAQIINDLITEMQTNMDEGTMVAVMSGDEEAIQKLMQDAIKQFMVKVGETEPSAETTDVTVKCEKVKVEVSGKEKASWMPVDMGKFVSDLEGAIFK